VRIMIFPMVAALTVLASAALSQQSPETGDTIGHPPPLPGPPPISEPSSTTQPAPAASTPRASEPAPKGYIGAHGPPGPSKPYSTGPLPAIDTGIGRDVIGPDGSTKTVKAVPCSPFARETDLRWNSRYGRESEEGSVITRPIRRWSQDACGITRVLRYAFDMT
jgi:hypothetical protein